MDKTPPLPPNDMQRIREFIRRYWGFDDLRPLQTEAIHAAVLGRDSLVILPTGGGKSLCYQVPPLLSESIDIVVSPLISLMKDQVDGLRSVGYPAAALHSGLGDQERRQIEAGLQQGDYRLLMVSPERLVQPSFLQTLSQLDIRRFVIDEAHCISHWGHDFRPEYRQLALLRRYFPKTSFHAFTATATTRVRQDILDQLHLRNPAVLIGVFDRPNLVYRVIPKVDLYEQTLEILRRHQGEASIVYCLSRKETEATAKHLSNAGLNAAHYHAGMSAQERRKTQEAFSNEQLDIVVATVAFGMGIDRSNVRCVLHAGLPQSIEHYQQETGRAGRDGLEAECLLLYSASDVMRWKSLMMKQDGDIETPPEIIEARLKHLQQIRQYANTPACRHKFLSEYFDQPYNKPDCGACDFCLSESETVPESTVLAQKILSCVARVDQRFGVTHVIDVLQGADTEAIRRFRHDNLSTYALLKEHKKKEIRSWIYQLIDQGLLNQTDDEFPVLRLNDQSWAVLRGQLHVRLIQLVKEKPKRTRYDEESWADADRGLFDRLRAWRKELAAQRNVPPYVILHDSVLQALSAIRPTHLETLRLVPGIGEKRTADLGDAILGIIQDYCRQNTLTVDNPPASDRNMPSPSPEPPRNRNASNTKKEAFALFEQNLNLEDIAKTIGRARSTTFEYLTEYIAEKQPQQIDAWVDQATYASVADAAALSEDGRLKPIFDRLSGNVPYEIIRLVLAHLKSMHDR